MSGNKYKNYLSLYNYSFIIKFTPMSVIYIMIPVSILIALVFFVLFIKTVKSGQYDDVYTPSVRMLFDDELVSDKQKTKTNK